MSKNDITGDEIRSRIANEHFRTNFDNIFKAGIVECKRCGKKMRDSVTTIHTCTPKEGWVDWEEAK